MTPLCVPALRSLTEPTHNRDHLTLHQHYQSQTLSQYFSLPRHKHTVCLLHLSTHKASLPKKLVLPVIQHCSRFL